MAMRIDDGANEESIMAEINITPLTDIFLVLLIIFMISSSAMMEGGLNVKLPTAKSSSLTSSSNSKPIYVTIDKDGGLSVGDKRAVIETLTDVLREAVAGNPDKTVVIRGDEGVILGRAVQIMDAARNAGAQKIAIATQSPN